jgi:hypothetical protein
MELILNIHVGCAVLLTSLPVSIRLTYRRLETAFCHVTYFVLLLAGQHVRLYEYPMELCRSSACQIFQLDSVTEYRLQSL